MIDPRIGSASDYNSGPWDGGMPDGHGRPDGFGAPGGMSGQDPWGGGESMEERMLARRAERMYQGLAAQGKYSQIDKAKHDKNYRNYLLQNYDENDMGY